MIDFRRHNDIRQLISVSIQTEQGSWWGDETIGSSMTLLLQSPNNLSSENLPKGVKASIRESVSWLLRKNLAKSVDIETSTLKNNQISWRLLVSKPDSSNDRIKELYHAT